jgi:type III secretion protein U
MSEKTEQPTHKKLRDARDKGDVPRSKDASTAFLLCGCISYLIFCSHQIVDTILSMVQWAGIHAYHPFPVIIDSFLRLTFEVVIAAVAPFVGIVIGMNILGSILFTGVLFAPEKIKPSFKKMSVIGNVKNIFSMRNLLEAAKSVAKVVVLTLVLWTIMRDNLPALLLVPAAGVTAVGTAFSVLLKAMMIATALVFSIVAGMDLLLQRQLFFREQKMSKDEVKREYKEMEGDPHVKHHRKSIHREIMMESGRQAVRRSSAVVTNPIHFAVALHYEDGLTPLPIVVAKGEGAMAYAIADEARDAGVPVIENVPLARALIADADVDDYVPAHLLDGVIEVLRAVREMGSTWD